MAAAGAAPRLARSMAVRATGFACLWWVLAEGRPDAWGLALAAVAAAVALSCVTLPPGERTISAAGLLGFIAFFLWHSVKGGVQVAAIALRPRLDLSPTTLEVTLWLPAGAPRVLMTAAIGLMPGTVGLQLEDDRLRLHVLDRRLPAAAEAQALQARIARLFGIDA